MLNFDRILIMGIVNVTPDSFSDGGQFITTDAAVEHAWRLAGEGADIVDIGGESTRPGAAPVPVAEEMRRVLPVVEQAAALGLTVSIDTRRAEVARAALESGATIINDVTGLRDRAMRRVAAEHQVPAVVMHMPIDDPATMQQHTQYGDVVLDVMSFLDEHAGLALAEGVPQVIVDPGIGFGKTADQNIELIRRLSEVAALGYPVMVGASRKQFIGTLTGADTPLDRVAGSIAVHLAAISAGARLVRVHDVAAHRQAITMWEALGRAQRP
jgi:dihydropteroate synthase